jgi:hypothetical protein
MKRWVIILKRFDCYKIKLEPKRECSVSCHELKQCKLWYDEVIKVVN